MLAPFKTPRKSPDPGLSPLGHGVKDALHHEDIYLLGKDRHNKTILLGPGATCTTVKSTKGIVSALLSST